MLTQHREPQAGEEPGLVCAAQRTRAIAGAHHGLRIGGNAGEAQGVPGLDCDGQIGRAAEPHRPATIFALGRQEFCGDALAVGVAGDIERLEQKQLLGGDGCVALELAPPVAIGLLHLTQVVGALIGGQTHRPVQLASGKPGGCHAESARARVTAGTRPRRAALAPRASRTQAGIWPGWMMRRPAIRMA